MQRGSPRGEDLPAGERPATQKNISHHSPRTPMEKWAFICLMEDGKKEKRFQEADTPEEAEEIIRNKNIADSNQKRIESMMLIDM
jgi:hypothetical protein